VGRFHVLDLARELDALGHEVIFYTGITARRAEKFGLRKRCVRTLLPWLLPLLLLDRVARGRFRRIAERVLYQAVDALVRRRLESCDVLICMSGVFVKTAAAARQRFGARVILERGSVHIETQRDILADAGVRELPTDYVIRRELAGYALADRISVPSEHAARTFIDKGVSAERLIINPYGVDLEIFCPKRRTAPGRTVLFIGRWSRQKGADLVIEAIRRMPGAHLVHAGAIGDVDFPEGAQFHSMGHVDQTRLPSVYETADVLVLPSRQEGLALVLIQALGCGVPVVCSERSGGADLRRHVAHPEAIIVLPSATCDNLVAGLEAGLRISNELLGSDLLGPQGRAALSWRAYAGRYSLALLDLVGRTQ
jgi:starch synthase